MTKVLVIEGGQGIGSALLERMGCVVPVNWAEPGDPELHPMLRPNNPVRNKAREAPDASGLNRQQRRKAERNARKGK